MGKYGNVAKIAVDLINSGENINPVDAWNSATYQVFPDSESSRKKGCPRGAFLGLCEEGLVLGIESGQYTRAEKNKGYALKALELLKNNPELSSNEKELWKLVVESEKQSNHQMDVVITLFEEQLLAINKVKSTSFIKLFNQKLANKLLGIKNSL